MHRVVGIWLGGVLALWAVTAVAEDLSRVTALLAPARAEREERLKRTAQSVMRVACASTDAVGTAFMLKGGKVLATESVVRGCTTVVLVRSEGLLVNASVRAIDSDADLALLEPEQPIAGPHLSLGIVAPTDLVQFDGAGYPAGYLGKAPLPVNGHLAGIQMTRAPSGNAVPRMVVQASLNGGYAGSPLTNESGKVIGVLTGRLSPLSDTSLAALRALQTQHVGPSYNIQRQDGSSFSVTNGQIIAYIVDEMRRHVHFMIGYATPVEDVRYFLVRNGVEP